MNLRRIHYVDIIGPRNGLDTSLRYGVRIQSINTKRGMMSEEDKLNEAVEQAVEVAANKAAEEEIQELTEFESAVDETLATGYLDDTLTVTDSDGVAQVLPVLDSEPISHLVKGLEEVGGTANVFVHTAEGVVALSVVEYKPNDAE